MELKRYRIFDYAKENKNPHYIITIQHQDSDWLEQNDVCIIDHPHTNKVLARRFNPNSSSFRKHLKIIPDMEFNMKSATIVISGELIAIAIPETTIYGIPAVGSVIIIHRNTDLTISLIGVYHGPGPFIKNSRFGTIVEFDQMADNIIVSDIKNNIKTIPIIFKKTQLTTEHSV